MYKNIGSLYDMAVDRVPGIISAGGIPDAVDKLTMYSLYKQIEEGNVPSESEFMGTKDVKYNAWCQQFNKNEWVCKREYILLISEHDKEL